MGTYSNHKSQLFLINWIRGFCAVFVLLGHSRVYGWGHNYDNSIWQSFFYKLLLAATSLGYESVAIFFVISGYLVGGQVLRHAAHKHFPWIKFLIDRLSRLYVVLLPGLALTFGIGLLLRDSVEKAEFRSLSDLSTFGCNLAFMMPTRCPPFAGNSSLWSLGYEFYFYVFFALVVNFIIYKSTTKRIFYAAFIIFILIVFTPKLLILLPAWLAGVFVYWLEQRALFQELKYIKMRWFFSFILLIFAVFISNQNRWSANFTILFISFCCIPFVYYAIVHSSLYQKPTSRIFRSFDFIGDSAYSLYVIHFPLVILIFNYMSSESGILGVIQIYGVALIILLINIIPYYLFERNTRRVRLALYRRFRIAN